MKSTIFYVIVALFATAQAVIVRSPGPDVAAESGKCHVVSGKYCKWPLSVSASHYDVAYGLHILLLGSIADVTRRPSLLSNRSLTDLLTISFVFSFFFSRPFKGGV